MRVVAVMQETMVHLCDCVFGARSRGAGDGLCGRALLAAAPVARVQRLQIAQKHLREPDEIGRQKKK